MKIKKCFLKLENHIIISNFAECMTGYNGLNCTAKCPYPTYGNSCQGLCLCSNDFCNMITGCYYNATHGTEPLKM